MLASPLALATARGHVGPRARRLRLFNLHTHEAFECALEPGEMPARELLKTFDFFMRDHYCGRVGNMDPSLIEHMMTLTEALEAPGEMIHVISAYRAPATNRMLQERGKKVAQHSLHLTGQAIDIRMPDVALRDIRDAALDLRVGGVGYYRKSNFLHFDTGRIRRW
ncbi:MAG: DUF882 domain-containing protein [Burkholderiaceae bacterium]